MKISILAINLLSFLKSPKNFRSIVTFTILASVILLSTIIFLILILLSLSLLLESSIIGLLTLGLST